MKLFKKEHGYDIITDMESNLKVQEIAKKHRIDESAMSVQMVGTLIEEKPLVRIRFDSNVPETIVLCDIVNELWDDCLVAIRRKLIFVWKREGAL